MLVTGAASTCGPATGAAAPDHSKHTNAHSFKGMSSLLFCSQLSADQVMSSSAPMLEKHSCTTTCITCELSKIVRQDVALTLH